MRLRFQIWMFLLAVLLLAIAITSGCNAPASDAAEPGKSSKGGSGKTSESAQLFKSIIDKLSAADIMSVAIIRIDDMVKQDPNRERQVEQQILNELTNVDGLKVVEGDQKEIENYFAQKGVDPSRGLSTDASINLCVLLNVDAIIYVTIESEDCDVNVKVYQAKDGGVIISEMVEALKLPVDKEKKKFELPPDVLEPGSATGSE